MKVVVHQVIDTDQEMKAGDHSRQHREKLLSVFLIEKDVLPSIPTSGDVIERPGKFDAERPGHV